MFDAICLWLAQNYSAEVHLSGLKFAGMMCSYADIAAIFLFAKIRDLALNAEFGASSKQKRANLIIYRALALCALLTLALFLPQTSATFFAMQFVVLLIPYLILIHVVATGVKPLTRLLKSYIKEIKSAP
ncbi:hypothetical protein AGMMS49957_17650 [Synergistales bacterium]|nr:hypothetical protein AGMMS49957_17650 [Synergistales bacterium]